MQCEVQIDEEQWLVYMHLESSIGILFLTEIKMSCTNLIFVNHCSQMDILFLILSIRFILW